MSHFPRAAGAVTAGVGIAVLLGWALGVDALKSVFPGLVTMKANTALAFALAGLALFWKNGRHRDRPAVRRLARSCALAVGLIGLLTLSEYGLGIDLAIDQLLFAEPRGAVGTSSPGRMAPMTALCFLLIGSALGVLDSTWRGRRPAEALAAGVAFAAVLGIIGYIYRVPALYGVGSRTQMAFHTALAFAVLAAGILFSRPDRGVMGLLVGDTVAAALARRLLPAVIAVPVALGWLRLQGERAGLYGGEFGLALMVVAMIVLLSGTILLLGSVKAAEAGRDRAEAGLRLYAELARNTPVGLTVWRLADLKDPGTFTLTACNSAAERLLGLPLATRLGETMPEVFPGAAASEMPEQYAEVVKRGQARDFGEIGGQDATTRGRVFAIRGFPLPDQSLGFSFEDVTDRKEAEAEVRRERDAAEAARKELEAFSYSVAHDLRAPLRAIQGFSGILLEEHAGTLTEDGRATLLRVVGAAQRMGQLIDGLLDLSRVSRTEMSRGPIDLSGLVRAVVTEFQASEPARKVDLVVQDGVRAEGDPRLLRAALANLIGNAWKFTSKVPEARIEFGLERYRGQGAFFVRDNGAGFDMRHADKLFGAFQRLHPARDFQGTGIGLATVQRIIHRHDGRVWAEGEPGKGATFYFTLSEGGSHAEQHDLAG